MNAIAIFHCSIKIISRGKGKSAVAAAAYRSGEKITNDYDGIIHDYTKKGGVVHTEILLPDNAPREYADRFILWNAVEKIEKNKNAQLAREIELALPIELDFEQQKALIKEYCEKHFVSARMHGRAAGVACDQPGMVADVCIHDKKDSNPHAHIMLTMRPFEQDGSWGAKSKKEYLLDENGEKILLKSGEYKSRKINSTDWNEQTKAEEWRSGWAELCNQYLSQNNVAERLDHRSYERQGIEQIPTIHLGVAASQMERKGILTDRGNINRQIAVDNQALRQLRARINKLKIWVEDETKNTNIADNSAETPNLLATLTSMLGDNEKSYWQKVFDLKSVAKAVLFLQTNNITTMPELQEKVTAMRDKFDSVSIQIKTKEKRLKVLQNHINHATNYRNYSAIYKQYKSQKPNKQNAFYESHRQEVSLYESAEKYLKPLLNGKQIPLNSWQVENTKLTTEKQKLYKDYYQLKEEVRQAEIIKTVVTHVVEKDLSKSNIKRTHETEKHR